MRGIECVAGIDPTNGKSNSRLFQGELFQREKPAVVSATIPEGLSSFLIDYARSRTPCYRYDHRRSRRVDAAELKCTLWIDPSAIGGTMRRSDGRRRLECFGGSVEKFYLEGKCVSAWLLKFLRQGYPSGAIHSSPLVCRMRVYV